MHNLLYELKTSWKQAPKYKLLYIVFEAMLPLHLRLHCEGNRSAPSRFCCIGFTPFPSPHPTNVAGARTTVTRGVNIEGANFEGRDMSGVSFQQSLVRGTNFKDAKLVAAGRSSQSSSRRRKRHGGSLHGVDARICAHEQRGRQVPSTDD